MCFSQVTTRVLNKGVPGEVWFVFETDHPDLLTQTEKMIEDGGLYGTRHETVLQGRDRRITSSFQMFVDRSAIIAVTELRNNLINAAGEVVA